MCGIFFYYGIKYIGSEELMKYFELIRYRGPDDTVPLYNIKDNINFGFHRLSINGLDKASGQPFIQDEVYLICNGEIYNYKKLAKEYNIKLKTHSDCEILIPLYLKLGFHEMVKKLEGVFALVLYDSMLKTVYIARDPVGIRPLFMGKMINDSNEYLFASEAKCLYNKYVNLNTINQFRPGSYLIINSKGELSQFVSYINLFHNTKYEHYTYKMFQKSLKMRIDHAVEVRTNITDRPVGALLSGGIDSSIVAMIAQNKLNTQLCTFSIGLIDGHDLAPAKFAAEAIGSLHTEVIFTIEEGLNAIEEVIRILETPDITTIRASLPMYLLSKYIKQNTDITVVLSGEGPDEVLAGYLYNHNAPNSAELNADAIMRISELPYYDVLRSDRSTASNSLEVRVPFLCKKIVKLATGTNPDYRNPNYKLNNGIEKNIMRRAFENLQEYKPDATDKQIEKWKFIINRPKEAFSDGVGYEWKKSLANLANSLISDEEFSNRTSIYSNMTPTNKEAFLYRKIYEKYYARPSNIPLVNNYWLPTWSNHGGDPSATVLDIHKARIN